MNNAETYPDKQNEKHNKQTCNIMSNHPEEIHTNYNL
jgi:hypothetical protein